MLTRRLFPWGPTAAAILIAGAALPSQAAFYQDKSVSVIVGFTPGGGTDTSARTFLPYFSKYTPGKPNFVVRNMPGAGGRKAWNFFADKAKPDGLTLIWNPWDPIGKGTGDKGLKADYTKLQFIGGAYSPLLNYIRTDVPPGIKSAPDVLKTKSFKLGGNRPNGALDLRARLSLELLGLNYIHVYGYRGTAKTYAAVKRNEVQVQTSPLSFYRAVVEPNLIKTGQAVPLYYHPAINAAGKIMENPYIKDIRSFPAFHKQVKGTAPAGLKWKALAWIYSVHGQMTFTCFAPEGTSPKLVADLRQGYHRARVDKEYLASTAKQFTVPFSFVELEEGLKIIQSVSAIDPEVRKLLKKYGGSRKKKRKK